MIHAELSGIQQIRILSYRKDRKDNLERILFAIKKFGEENPSQQRIARYIKRSRKTVNRLLKILRQEGLLEVIKNGIKRVLMLLQKGYRWVPKKMPYTYKILDDCPESRDGFSYELLDIFEHFSVDRKTKRYRYTPFFDCPFCNSPHSFMVHDDRKRGKCNKCEERANAGKVYARLAAKDPCGLPGGFSLSYGGDKELLKLDTLLRRDISFFTT